MTNEFSTVSALAHALSTKQVSSVELTQSYLDRAAAANPALNAYITLTADAALASAAVADAARATGTAHPLCGIPLAHKDIFCTKGQLTTCGSKMLSNFVAPYNATVVERLESAGMVVLGKCNMDEFAMGSSNENSHYGPVRNPWDSTRVPGGSSGGSAAAVAAGLAPIATGTDTGGSIRQPASFCGVTGIKPTYGRVSRFGMIAFASSLDQAGLLAQDATDAAWVLGAMAGFDPQDSTSADHATLDLTELVGKPLSAPEAPLKIGLPREYFDNLDPAVASLLAEAQAVLEAQGHRFVDLTLPHTPFAVPAYYVIAGAEASTNLSRYDGVRFGHRCDNPVDLADLYTRSRSEAFGSEVKRRILTGTYALSVGYFDAYYVRAQKIRRLIQQDFLARFADVDLILAPVAPSPAFHLGNLTEDPVAMYQQDIYTVPASLAGLPAMSVPCGFIDNAPIGMQLIAPHFAEANLLRTAFQFQQHTDWHRRHPT